MKWNKRFSILTFLTLETKVPEKELPYPIQKKETHRIIGDWFILAKSTSFTEVHVNYFAGINQLIVVSSGKQAISKVEDNRKSSSGLPGEMIPSENQVEISGRY